MGEHIKPRDARKQNPAIFYRELRADDRVLTRMMRGGWFATKDPHTIGIELEGRLFGPQGFIFRNQKVLGALGRLGVPYVNELGADTIETETPPMNIAGRALEEQERILTNNVAAANAVAAKVGGGVALAGMPPIAEERHLDPAGFTLDPPVKRGKKSRPAPRYKVLDEGLRRMRSGIVDAAQTRETKKQARAAEQATGTVRPATIHIHGGPEEVNASFDSIAPEMLCTSAQFHLQASSPDEMVRFYNAALAAMGPLVAISENSPYFLGKEAWRESRIPVFEQIVDERTPRQKAAGAPSRVFFGDKFIDTADEPAHTLVKRFKALFPIPSGVNSFQQFHFRKADGSHGKAPGLKALERHVGSTYGWLRAIYRGDAEGVAHWRVEVRPSASGPTVPDVVANEAFLLGIVQVLARPEAPVSAVMAFADTKANFYAGAKVGLKSTMAWPDHLDMSARDLILKVLLPMAREGLREFKVAPDLIDRYLGIIEGRTRTGMTGAEWQVQTVKAFEAQGLARDPACARMYELLTVNSASSTPVHEWPVAQLVTKDESAEARQTGIKAQTAVSTVPARSVGTTTASFGPTRPAAPVRARETVRQR